MGWLGLASWLAVVMSADLTAIGDHVGYLLRIRAAMPAMCGLDIEVPERALKTLPPRSPAGAPAAMTPTPGAVMSGLRRSPLPARAGPNDENPPMAGARTGIGRTAEIVAVGLTVAAYALIAGPATLST